MKRMVLPPEPDFGAMDTALERTAPQRQAFLAQIGDLNFTWSNNESMLIYILMLLLRTDEVAAAIVFATLNTTRSRLDLAQRLAKTHVTDTALRAEIDRLIADFASVTRVRNEFNHTTFAIDAAGSITHTQSVKLEENRGKLRFGVRKPVDDARRDELAAAIMQLKGIHKRLWNILPRLRDHMFVSDGP